MPKFKTINKNKSKNDKLQKKMKNEKPVAMSDESDEMNWSTMEEDSDDDSTNDVEKSEDSIVDGNDKEEDSNSADDDDDEESDDTSVKQNPQVKTKTSRQINNAAKGKTPKKLPTKKVSSRKRKANEDGNDKKRKIPKFSEITGDELEEYYKRIDERNSRTLLIKLNKATAEPAKVVPVIKEWSDDITDIRRSGFRLFIEFGSEEQANKNYKIFQKKKILGKEFVLDFIGKKARFSKEQADAKRPATKAVNKFSLCVEGLDKKTARGSLYEEFPTASDIKIALPHYKSPYAVKAFVGFKSEALAKATFDASANKVINGRQVLVIYASTQPQPRKENVTKSDKPELFTKKTLQQKLKGRYRKKAGAR